MPAVPFWRVALRPRWLALLGVVLVLCVGFGWLGKWQLDVARSKSHPAHLVGGAPVPLDQVTKPQQVFTTGMQGRPVTVAGEYDAQRQVLVTGKSEGGEDAVWVLTALRTTSGALVPVVRGFTTERHLAIGDQRFDPPVGNVTVRGVLQAPEADVSPPAAPAARGTLRAADTADLVNLWSAPIYNVLVLASAPTPASSGTSALAAVPPAPPDNGGGLGLRNAAYAVQWWIFAAFAVVLWWRMVREDAIDQQAEPDSPSERPDPKELTAT